MRAFHRSLSIAVVTAVAAAGLSMSASATEVPRPTAQLRPSQPSMAAGVIVQTTGSKPSAALLRAAESALPGEADVATVRRRGNNSSVLVTNRRIPAAQAETLAAELRKRSDVVSASPNYIRHAFGAAPVVTDDTYFNLLRQVWDPRPKTDTDVKAALGSTNSFPDGGYSSKAPSLWRSTTGTGEVVAVVDTGITDHPDLDNQVLPGYDFISVDGSGIDWARDGDGRDSIPDDMGDWENANESCDGSGDTYSSSWHGTHVSGIIAAESNNALGVAGVAPGAKILPVRVLGLCGGVDEDIADGIRWAAGLPVAGAPNNANPADVINLSLGGSGKCSDSPILASAITAARSAGSVVVAAAGNDGINIDSSPVTPATCPGVISVGATSQYGDRAGYKSGTKKVIYSNFGASLDISAPGGDAFWKNAAILSTLNAGSTSPASATYDDMIGTSMAAPVVSAGAALIRSLGTFTPDQTEAALKVAVAPFPTSANTQFKKCTTSICGKGIIDLSKVPAPRDGAAISGSPIVGETLTAVPGTWLATPSAFTYAWLRDGSPIASATGASYTVTHADEGSKLSVRVAPVTAVFSPIISTSPETTAVPQGPTVTLSDVPTSTTYGVGGTVTVTVTSGVDPVNGPVELRRGNTVIASGDYTGAPLQLQVPGTAWIGGANPIRAAFLGGGTQPASSSTTQIVTVAKATSTIAISLPATVKKTARASLTVTIAVSGDTQPTGSFDVYDGTKKILSSAVATSDSGVKTILLPKITKTGAHKIKVTYLGNGNITGKTSAVKTLTVK